MICRRVHPVLAPKSYLFSNLVSSNFFFQPRCYVFVSQWFLLLSVSVAMLTLSFPDSFQFLISLISLSISCSLNCFSRTPKARFPWSVFWSGFGADFVCPLSSLGKALPGEDKGRKKSAPKPLQNTGLTLTPNRII